MNIEKRLKNVEQDPILNGLVKTFQSKMVKARILKLWLLIRARTQLIQKFPRASLGIQFIKDVESYIKSCKIFQKQGDLKLKMSSKLHSIPVPSTL